MVALYFGEKMVEIQAFLRKLWQFKVGNTAPTNGKILYTLRCKYLRGYKGCHVIKREG